MVSKEMPTEPPRFRSRLVKPVASPICSRDTVATEKVVMVTKMAATAKPLRMIGQSKLPGAIKRLISPSQYIDKASSAAP